MHSAGDFTAIGTGGFLTEIAFRYSSQTAFFGGATASNVMISASTTQRGPNSLSPVFAENTGPDEVTVFGTAAVTIPGGDAPGFDLFITLNTPFLYDPRVGNLLLDFRNFGGISPAANTPGFDSQNVTGDSVSTVGSANPYSSVAEASSSLGVIMRFTFAPIPEPSTSALLVLACLGVIGARQLRTIKKGKRRGTAGSTTP